MSCEMCTDSDGVACFPMYGLGPHSHPQGGGSVLIPGATMAGYTENPAEPGHGWHWCPSCGDGKSAAAEVSFS